MTLFEAYVTNAGKYADYGVDAGEILKFPTTTEEVQSLLKRIGVDGVRYQEIFIVSFDGDVLGLYDYLSEYENLDELNHLAHLLSELDQGELETLEAVLNKGDHTSSVADIINLVHNLDCYDLHPGVSDDETLGRIYVEDMGLLEVPENLINYFDFEAYGRDMRLNEGGHFAPGGYLTRVSNNFVELYHGIEDIPPEHRVFAYPQLSIREQMAAYKEIIDGSARDTAKHRMEIIVFLSIVIAVGAVLTSIVLVRRVKKQIAEMTDVLVDVKNGNGNRRILSATNELTAPLAYEINEIVVAYESRLSTVRQTEETNRQLMTSLSHDVRTPLTTLLGYLDATHKGLVTGKDRDDYIETARRKAHDLKEYIDVLFDWFKLNSNEFALEIQSVEAAELTRNILIDWIPIFEDKQVEYDIDIPEQPVRVRLDMDSYMRIVNNLIQNVIAHSHADKIKIALSKKENNMELLLADNGVGIEKEDLKHIFERLYKCDKGRSEKGSGLGLSIVHQLVEKMGGSITVESLPGKGTEFMLLFPLES